MSNVIERFPLLIDKKYVLTSSIKGGPKDLVSSPTLGSSIFTTSAPKSANYNVAYGDA